MKSALLFGSEDHDHLAAFELGRMLDLSNIDKLLTDAVHELSAELLVSHFASAEAQRDLGLVAVLKEALQAAQFRLEVVLIRGRTELDFLDLDDFLLGLGFLSLLLLLIAELAIRRQTGGTALGATSTKSTPASSAMRRASDVRTIPIWAPSTPVSRTSGTRISLLIRCLRS